LRARRWGIILGGTRSNGENLWVQGGPTARGLKVIGGITERVKGKNLGKKKKGGVVQKLFQTGGGVRVMWPGSNAGKKESRTQICELKRDIFARG